MKKTVVILISILLLGCSLYDVETRQLDNNMNVIYRYIPNTKVVSVQVWVKTGSVNESEEISGISHFLEHMVFKGAGPFAPGEIDETVESQGGMMNAATSKDYTFYYVTLPSFNAESAFEVLSSMVYSAKFIPEEIDKEKPVVLQEIKRKYDSPTHDMWAYVLETVFEGSPYSRQVIGTSESVSSFSREQLLDYYNRFYHPENMTLVIAGDLPPEDAFRLSEKYFDRVKDVQVGKGFTESVRAELDKNIEKVFHKEVAQEYGIVAFPSEGMAVTDKYAAEILSEMLAGGEFSIISDTIKNKLQLASAVDAGYLGLKLSGAFVVSYISKPGNGTEIKDEVLKIVSSTDEFMTEKLFEKAKNRLKSQIAFQREKASSEANDIGFSYTLDMPDYYHDFLDNIDRVKLEDVKSFAEELFSSRHVFVRTLPE